MLTLFDPKLCEVSAYRADLQNICGQFDVVTKDPNRQVQGSLSMSRSNGLDVAFVSQNANIISRDTAQIRHDPGDHFFLVIQHKGNACMSQGGHETWLSPGDMFVTDATKPSEFYYGGAYSEQISLHLPRVDMLHRYGTRISGGLSIFAKEDLASAIHSILLKLLSPSEVCQSHVLEAFYSVFGAILTDRKLDAGQKLNPDRQIYMSFAPLRHINMPCRAVDECLYETLLASLSDAREDFAKWQDHYNNCRPHSSIAT